MVLHREPCSREFKVIPGNKLGDVVSENMRND
jgi:hypothetical protein